MVKGIKNVGRNLRPWRDGIQGLIVASVVVLLIVASTVSAFEIWEIQGPGMESPKVGQRVITQANVVFAVGAEGFFIQTPDNRSDGIEQTSDGIYVFTGSPSGVGVGDLVDVTATVIEYRGLTELGNSPAVTVRATGQVLPSAVLFDRDTPRSDQPWEETTLERFEGMRIQIEKGVVCSATNSYGDAWVSASDQGRLRREPGIQWPGLEDLPVFDGNPQGFELDPDALGLADVEVIGGTRFGAEGALSYAWGDYQLWPTRLELEEQPFLPRSAPSAQGTAIRVATQNVERLGRSLSQNYQLELAKDALQVAEVLGLPDIVGIQEVEDLGALEDLAAAILEVEPQVVYRAYLIDGDGYGGINVGFLVRDPIVVTDEIQIGADVIFDWDGYQLFDRPPLVLEVAHEAFQFEMTVVVVHLRSLRGIDDSGDGPRVRAKRDAQARWLADWVQSRQNERPDEPLLIVGDFNAFEFSDGYVDVIGQITGLPDPLGALLPASVAVDPPLFDGVAFLSDEERYSYVYQGNIQVLDHILLNQGAVPLVAGVRAVRGNADVSESYEYDRTTPLRSSDHDGLVMTLRLSNARDSGGGGR